MRFMALDDSQDGAERTTERWTPDRRRARTRAALVDAARTVFARKGFEGASLDEIADTAGYTRGAIYKHFDGKEDLLLAVFDLINDEALDAFSRLLDLEPGSAMDPTTIAETWHRLHTDDFVTQALDLEFRLYELRHPEVRERAEARRRRGHELIAEFMRSHSSEAGIEFKVPLEMLTSILLITSDGFSLDMQFEPDIARLYQEFLALFLPTVITQRTP
jgi:AcrR family transcriptional regulator